MENTSGLHPLSLYSKQKGTFNSFQYIYIYIHTHTRQNGDNENIITEKGNDNGTDSTYKKLQQSASKSGVCSYSGYFLDGNSYRKYRMYVHVISFLVRKISPSSQNEHPSSAT